MLVRDGDKWAMVTAQTHQVTTFPDSDTRFLPGRYTVDAPGSLKEGADTTRLASRSGGHTPISSNDALDVMRSLVRD